MRIDDPALVRAEYADERRLAGRKRTHRFGEGPDARTTAFEAIAEVAPDRVLEVGCGEGELAERMVRELGCELIATDQSERMVELTRERGLDARVADVRDLPFADAEFDAVLAAWMLFHVAEVDVALGELARVVRSGGRLVAVTVGAEHLGELVSLLGVERTPLSFDGDNGERLLSRHFPRVDRREAFGWIAFPDREEAQAYVDATIAFGGRTLPALEGPLRVRRAPVVFVADKV